MMALTEQLQHDLNALNEVLLMASIAEEAMSKEDSAELIGSAMAFLQNLCAHYMETESEASMAALDVFGLCCAGLDYLGADESLDSEELVAVLSALFLPLADMPGIPGIHLAMDWLQRDEKYALLETEERERIESVLQAADTEVVAQEVTGSAESIDEQQALEAAFAEAVEESDSPEENTITDAIDVAAAEGEELDVPELGEDQIEILALLAAELTDMQEQQNGLLEAMGNSIDSDNKHVLMSLASRHEHLANVCAMVNLAGLQLYFGHLQNNFEYLAEQEDWPKDVEPLLQASLSLSSQYIAMQLERNAGTDLLVNWVDPQWPLAMPEDAHLMASEALLNPVMGELEDDRPPRQTQASAEDVSLVVPDDVNTELLESLLQELPDQTAEMSAALQSCIKNQFMDDLDTARRIAHTLKGAANVVGIRGVANLTHHMEDILDVLFKYNTVAVGSLAEVLMASADCLEGMCEALLGQGEAPDDALLVLQQVLDWANHLDEGGKEAVEKMASEAPEATKPVEQSAQKSEEESPKKEDKPGCKASKWRYRRAAQPTYFLFTD